MTATEVIERNSTPEPNTGCLLWTGSTNQWGYGRTHIKGLPERGAHRIAYSIKNGPIPGGTLVLHRCDVPACVNPDHLFLGSAMDNMRDMVRKGRNADTRGEKSPTAKLTWSAVAEIRTAAGHTTISALARRFGVCRRTIRFALRGDTWTR